MVHGHLVNQKHMHVCSNTLDQFFFHTVECACCLTIVILFYQLNPMIFAEKNNVHWKSLIYEVVIDDMERIFNF